MNFSKELWNEIFDVSIPTESLSARSRNVLEDHSIVSFQNLYDHIKYDGEKYIGLNLKGLGRKSIQEIEELVIQIIDELDNEKKGQIGNSSNLDLLPNRERSYLEIDISEINDKRLSVRVQNALKTQEYTKLSDLNGVTKRDMKKWPNMGAKSIELLWDLLDEYVLSSVETVDVDVSHWIPYQLIACTLEANLTDSIVTMLEHRDVCQKVEDRFPDETLLYKETFDITFKVRMKTTLSKTCDVLKLPDGVRNLFGTEETLWDIYKTLVKKLLNKEKMHQNIRVLEEIDKIILLGKNLYHTGWREDIRVSSYRFKGELNDYRSSIEQIFEKVGSKANETIVLENRILHCDKNQTTLQEAADLTEAKVSRERIRQIESKLYKDFEGIIKDNHFYHLDIIEKQLQKSSVICVEDFERNIYFDDFFLTFPEEIEKIFAIITIPLRDTVKYENGFIKKTSKGYQEQLLTMVNEVKETLLLLDDFPTFLDVRNIVNRSRGEVKYCLSVLGIEYLGNKIFYKAPNSLSAYLKRKLNSLEGLIEIDELILEYAELSGINESDAKRNIQAHLERNSDFIRFGDRSEYVGSKGLVSKSLQNDIRKFVFDLLDEREYGYAGAIVFEKLARNIKTLPEKFSLLTLIDLIKEDGEIKTGLKSFISLKKHRAKPHIENLIRDYLSKNPSATKKEIFDKSIISEFYSSYYFDYYYKNNFED